MTAEAGDWVELRGPRVALRHATRDDAAALLAILAEPEVARWWPGYDRDRVLLELIAERHAEVGFVIEVSGRIVGYIQAAEELEPDFLSAGIDLFLGASAQDAAWVPRPSGSWPPT